MSDSEPARITVYADYVCPFCYLGRESLAQYREDREAPVEVDWHPFDLRSRQRGTDGEIDESIDSGKDEDYYEEARQNVRRLADEYGVEMTLDLAREVDSRNAQLASVHVQMDEPENWLGFDRAIYDALWQDGRDIGDPDVLADLAEGVGLEPDEIRAALEDPMVERRLDDQFEAARLRGITGVPTFVYGEHSARGAVPPAQLRRLVEGH
jgi:predicted DsbA family dithiol-disulfide isomerase